LCRILDNAFVEVAGYRASVDAHRTVLLPSIDNARQELTQAGFEQKETWTNGSTLYGLPSTHSLLEVTRSGDCRLLVGEAQASNWLWYLNSPALDAVQSLIRNPTPQSPIPPAWLRNWQAHSGMFGTAASPAAFSLADAAQVFCERGLWTNADWFSARARAKVLPGRAFLVRQVTQGFLAAIPGSKPGQYLQFHEDFRLWLDAIAELIAQGE